MAYVASQFLARFPEFSNIAVPPNSGLQPSDLIQARLDDFDADTSDDFGTNRDRAVYLQVAHDLGIRYRINLSQFGVRDLQNPGISSGKQVAGHSVSEQFILPANMMQWRGDWRGYYSRTTYGLEYLMLCEKSLSKGVLSFDSTGGMGDPTTWAQP